MIETSKCCQVKARLERWWPAGYPCPPAAPWVAGIALSCERVATREEILTAVGTFITGHGPEELRLIIEKGEMRRESPLAWIAGAFAVAAGVILAAVVIYSDDIAMPGGQRFEEVEGMGADDGGGEFWNPPGKDECDDPFVYC